MDHERDGKLHETLAGKEFQRGIAKHRNNNIQWALLQSRNCRAWPDLSTYSDFITA